MDTFSANSLKILQISKTEFERKFIDKIELIEENKDAILGNKFHSLICYYLKNYNIQKFENSLLENEKEIFEKIKTSKIMTMAKNADEKFIEQPFFTKETINNKPFYLTGRFDAVLKINDKYIILDWKTKNLPKDVNEDIQTIVYLHCASKLFKTNNVEMIYYSLTNGEEKTAQFNDNIEKIKEIVSKIYN